MSVLLEVTGLSAGYDDVEIVKDLMPDSLAQLEKLAGEFEKTT